MVTRLTEKKTGYHLPDNVFPFLLLTLAGGFLDAYTYLLRGSVFANAQTGNLVLFGINLHLNGMKAVHYLFPVFSFVAGILISWFVNERFKGKNGFDWHVLILVFEFAVLICIGFVKPDRKYDDIVNITVSFITALQYGAFRKIADLPFATTMCTGMLRSGTDHLYKYIKQKKTKDIKISALYLLVVSIFIMGALFGSFAVKYVSEKAVWICDFIFLAVIIMVYVNNCSVKKKLK